MEGMGMNAGFWQGRRVFLTGHTGFKGGWLSLWLQHLGAQVTGYALEADTQQPSFFSLAQVGRGMHSIIGDVRDLAFLKKSLYAAEPEVVIHMAAQALVRPSYTDPVGTYSTNVMGTVHLLEAARSCQQVRAVLNVTTDKCYENREWAWPYRENDALGGHDPYSNSKACSELVTQAYCRSFPELGAKGRIALASARAGNVIGGGDVARDRLIPDVVKSWQAHEQVQIRSPQAVRPWQFVLDPLCGYLMLAEQLYQQGQIFSGPWNFGPDSSQSQTVQWVVERLARQWGPDARWQAQAGDHVHEATTLKLDSSKAQGRLAWRPRLGLEDALEKTLDWYRTWFNAGDMHASSLDQIRWYEAWGAKP